MSGKFLLEIDCGNDAFGASQEEAAQELARILRNIAKELELLGDAPARPRDHNGNTVGKCEFHFEKD